MTRTILSSLAIAAMLAASAATPAVSQNRKPKYLEFKLEQAIVVPVSPLPSKHKGEMEVHSISPGASPSAGPPRKRRPQAR